MIIAGGIDRELRPLNSVYMFDVHSSQYTQLEMQGNLLPRYKKNSHFILCFSVSESFMSRMMDYETPYIMSVDYSWYHRELGLLIEVI